MKLKINILIVAAIAFALASCQKDNDTTEEPQLQEEQVADPQDQTPGEESGNEEGGQTKGFRVSSLNHTENGITASWDAAEDALMYFWTLLYANEEAENGVSIAAYGYTEETSIESYMSEGWNSETGGWLIDSFVSDTTYYFVVIAFGAGEAVIDETDGNDATFVITGN